MDDAVRDVPKPPPAWIFKMLPCLAGVPNRARLGLLLGLLAQGVKAETTWMYTVQINASVQTAPPRISLNWAPDPYSANSYTVYRKARDEAVWGAGTALSGSATGYVDTAVAVGSTYEYKVVKVTTNYTGYGYGYHGYGYIYSGINAPLIDNRGKLVLIVASNCAASLSNELARLQSDLTGDGWIVLRHDVPTNGTPASVR